ncbi:MAG: beta-galactosidase [Dehalococcoidia bacterium]
MGRVSRRMQVAILCAGAFAALVLLVGQLWLMRRLSWTHTEDPAASLIGINFSCDQAEYLLLEDPALGEAGYVSDDRPGRAAWCAGVLGTLLERTGAKYVRLSAQWDEVEPAEGKFDFALLDALLATAREHGATANLSVGMKGQRHPEYYIPDWAFEGTSLHRGEIISDDPILRTRALSMVTTVVQHFAGSPVIDSWGAENEPYIESERNDRYSLGRDYVAEVVDTIHANDPQGRPVMINHGQHFVMDRRWQDALADSDILGQSLYPRRNEHLFGVPIVVNVLELGPLMPNYAYQARKAHEEGKQFWIAELQGEPWTDTDSRLISPEHPSANLSPKSFAENITYARKTGADRVYLWGAEWWLYEWEFFSDGRWLDAAHDAIASDGADR